MHPKSGNRRQIHDLSVLVVHPINNMEDTEIQEMLYKLGFTAENRWVESHTIALKLIALPEHVKSKYNIIISHENNDSLKNHPEHFIHLPYNLKHPRAYLERRLTKLLPQPQ